MVLILVFIQLFLLYIGKFRLIKFLIVLEVVFLITFLSLYTRLNGCFSFVVFFARVLVIEAGVGLSLLVFIKRNFQKKLTTNSVFCLN